MKRLFYGYLHGLHQWLRKADDTEMYVIIILFVFEGITIIYLTTVFNIKLPSLDNFLPNKWLSRLIGGVSMYVLNKYIFGFRESNYTKYEPLSKKNTVAFTIGYFLLFILVIIFKGHISMIR